MSATINIFLPKQMFEDARTMIASMRDDLIHLIVWYASSRGEKLTTLRLVKFLYLADLYHARVSRGTTLTGWPWAFVHFGPYCQEAMSAIDRAGKSDSFQVNEQPS